MPTILFLNGWRFFFYANENNEPIHIHAQKAESEGKFWIKEAEFEIEEAWSYNMGPKDKRDVRQIIFSHFEYIIEQWNEFQNKKS